MMSGVLFSIPHCFFSRMPLRPPLRVPMQNLQGGMLSACPSIVASGLDDCLALANGNLVDKM